MKVYYDDGQHGVTEVLHDAVEYVASRNAVVYRDATPRRYRLSQLADYVCGIELINIKFNAKKETTTNRLFFDSRAFFRKNSLMKIRRKRIASAAEIAGQGANVESLGAAAVRPASNT